MDRFEIPLDIEDVKIERVEFTQNNEIIITVTSTLEGTHCHRCGQKITVAWFWERDYAPSFVNFRETDLSSD